jgi:hypothetical protein
MSQSLPLRRAVGVNQINHAADLATARNFLAARGLCARGLPGLTGVHLKADLVAAIRAFQRGAGFEPDGIIAPDGPTARALGETRTRPKRPKPKTSTRPSVLGSVPMSETRRPITTRYLRRWKVRSQSTIA